MNTLESLIGYPVYGTVNTPAAHGDTSRPQGPVQGPAPSGLTIAGSVPPHIWILAVGFLWLILVMLHQFGGTSRDVGTGLAMLIAVSVLLVLGPSAITQAKGFLQ